MSEHQYQKSPQLEENNCLLLICIPDCGSYSTSVTNANFQLVPPGFSMQARRSDTTSHQLYTLLALKQLVTNEFFTSGIYFVSISLFSPREHILDKSYCIKEETDMTDYSE